MDTRLAAVSLPAKYLFSTYSGKSNVHLGCHLRYHCWCSESVSSLIESGPRNRARQHLWCDSDSNLKLHSLIACSVRVRPDELCSGLIPICVKIGAFGKSIFNFFYFLPFVWSNKVFLIMFKRCCASTYFDVSLRPSAFCKVRSLAVDTGCPGNRAYFDCLRLAVFQMSHLTESLLTLKISQNTCPALKSFFCNVPFLLTFTLVMQAKVLLSGLKQDAAKCIHVFGMQTSRMWML